MYYWERFVCVCVCVNYLLYNKLPDGWAVCVCVCVCVCLCVSSRKSSIIYNNTPCVVFFVCIYIYQKLLSNNNNNKKQKQQPTINTHTTVRSPSSPFPHQHQVNTPDEPISSIHSKRISSSIESTSIRYESTNNTTTYLYIIIICHR